MDQRRSKNVGGSGDTSNMCSSGMFPTGYFPDDEDERCDRCGRFVSAAGCAAGHDEAQR